MGRVHISLGLGENLNSRERIGSYHYQNGGENGTVLDLELMTNEAG